MLDEIQVLQNDECLVPLLTHYADAGASDREAWQDRVMNLERVELQKLVKLHGKLIAFGWLEQNTGAAPILQQGTVRRCYRVTGIGLRALKIAKANDHHEHSAAA